MSGTYTQKTCPLCPGPGVPLVNGRCRNAHRPTPEQLGTCDARGRIITKAAGR